MDLATLAEGGWANIHWQRRHREHPTSAALADAIASGWPVPADLRNYVAERIRRAPQPAGRPSKGDARWAENVSRQWRVRLAEAQHRLAALGPRTARRRALADVARELGLTPATLARQARALPARWRHLVPDVAVLVRLLQTENGADSARDLYRRERAKRGG